MSSTIIFIAGALATLAIGLGVVVVDRAVGVACPVEKLTSNAF